jgi:hypothetical protein
MSIYKISLISQTGVENFELDVAIHNTPRRGQASR